MPQRCWTPLQVKASIQPCGFGAHIAKVGVTSTSPNGVRASEIRPRHDGNLMPELIDLEMTNMPQTSRKDQSPAHADLRR